MERLARIMEFFWLTLAVLSAAWCAWWIATIGWEGARFYTWFPLICTALYLYRRFTRRKMAQCVERRARETVDEKG